MTEQSSNRWDTPEGQDRARGATDGPTGERPSGGAETHGTSLPPYTPPSGGRRGLAFVALGVGAVLAVVAGVFAVGAIADDGAPETPEAAVEAMFAAINDQDVLGVLDTLAPSERELYQPFLEDMVGELQRLGVVSDELDLGSVRGVDLQVDGLELESSTLAPGISVVSVTAGTITGGVDPAQVPIGSFVRDLLDDPEAGVELQPFTDTGPLVEDQPIDLVVIDDDGWHVSLHYSLAEAVRSEAGAPLPDFGNGVAPEGAETPEAAVRALLQAAVDLDVRRVIALTPPGEMSALHDYAPLFLGDVEDAVDELGSSFDVAIDSLDTDVARDGDTATVAVSGFAVSGVLEDASFEVSYADGCYQVTYEGESEEVCPETSGPGGEGGATIAEDLLDAQLGVVTVERGGRWYVSPVRSTFQVLLAVVGAVDRSDLENPEQLLSEAFGLDPLLEGMMGFGGAGAPFAPGSGGFTPGGGSAQPLPGEECYAVYDELPLDATEEDFSAADDAFEECYAAATDS